MEMLQLEALQSCLTWKLVVKSLQGKWICGVQTLFCNWTVYRVKHRKLELVFYKVWGGEARDPFRLA